MGLTLHLGVKDIPYTHDDGKETGITTGDVAEILEKRYGVMEHFYDAHEDEVAKDIADSLEGALENYMMGSPVKPSLKNSAREGMSKTETRFKQFLASAEIERMGIRGVPTQAAQDRKSVRFKKGKNPEGARPSFIDSGLYKASFTAWVDETGDGN